MLFRDFYYHSGNTITKTSIFRTTVFLFEQSFFSKRFICTRLSDKTIKTLMRLFVFSKNHHIFILVRSGLKSQHGSIRWKTEEGADRGYHIGGKGWRQWRGCRKEHWQAGSRCRHQRKMVKY